jgi:rubredoxin
MNDTISSLPLANPPQWVCLVCGYNMIGEMTDICPFCGARHDQFMRWDEVEMTYRVTSLTVNGYVNQLLSVPKLGLEHAAYQIVTDHGLVWIDSPSAFNRDLQPAATILFTHHHFMGASNQYRRLWNSKVCLHELDARHPLAAAFDIDKCFSEDFVYNGIRSFHIGGHTPGFTLYIYRHMLFICDYVFLTNDGMRFNPYGPEMETRQRAKYIYEIISKASLNTVCGYNYVSDFTDWLPAFENLLFQH